MRQAKKYTQKQLISRLVTENGQQMNMIMQLAQEVQQIGQLAEASLNILKQMDNYEELLEQMKAKLDAERSEQAAEMPVTAEPVTPETSTSTAQKEYITDADGKGAIDFGDETS